jgi:hypothetical protein
MKLEAALNGLRDAQDKLANATAITSPTEISTQMMRLSQYAAAVDSHLAEYEREYEIKLSAKILEYINSGKKVSPSETLAKMELYEIRSQIKFLERLTSSAWKQVGVAQSRYNHLTQESRTNI